ncbi:hypothetical protein HDV00_006280 [Rhizophlyctis rosea]|nr:hypothetical protein HDV00_006280 [Rhizophlyctis rosea]
MEFERLEAMGFFRFPDANDDLDAEAERRLQCIRSCYSVSRETSEPQYWSSGATMQHLRAGVTQGSNPDTADHSETETPSRKRKRGSTDHRLDEDEKDETYHPRRTKIGRRSGRGRRWGRPSTDSDSEEEEKENDDVSSVDEDDDTPLTGRKAKLVSRGRSLYPKGLKKPRGGAATAAEPDGTTPGLVMEEQRMYQGESISHVFWRRDTYDVDDDGGPGSPSVEKGKRRSDGSCGQKPEMVDAGTQCESLSEDKGIQCRLEVDSTRGSQSVDSSTQCEGISDDKATQSGNGADESGEIVVNIFAKNGKAVVRNLRVSAVYTFAQLIQLLPLPSINEEEMSYACYRKILLN